ncbi:MAG: hypothetical protein NZZ41_04605 [Candidatus Dojkabacteria bacterium]|nr:hypothetical protein [Candidatus Dojkabacteria bacterium]
MSTQLNNIFQNNISQNQNNSIAVGDIFYAVSESPEVVFIDHEDTGDHEYHSYFLFFEVVGIVNDKIIEVVEIGHQFHRDENSRFGILFPDRSVWLSDKFRVRTLKPKKNSDLNKNHVYFYVSRNFEKIPVYKYNKSDGLQAVLVQYFNIFV